MSWEYERSFYRIRYPIAERPRLWSGSCAFEVLDCCEGGLRYEYGSEPRPQLGDAVTGRLRFHDGTELEVEGEVIRIQDGAVALNLTKNRIPFSVILSEQRALLRRYLKVD